MMKHLQNEDLDDMDTSLELIDLFLSITQGEWLVDMFEYACNKPHIVVNVFVCSGITAALDSDIHSDTPLSEESNSNSISCDNSIIYSSDSETEC